MDYTPKEIARAAFGYLPGVGDGALMARLAHKHMYLFCGMVTY